LALTPTNVATRVILEAENYDLKARINDAPAQSLKAITGNSKGFRAVGSRR